MVSGERNRNGRQLSNSAQESRRKQNALQMQSRKAVQQSARSGTQKQGRKAGAVQYGGSLESRPESAAFARLAPELLPAKTSRARNAPLDDFSFNPFSCAVLATSSLFLLARTGRARWRPSVAPFMKRRKHKGKARVAPKNAERVEKGERNKTKEAECRRQRATGPDRNKGEKRTKTISFGRVKSQEADGGATDHGRPVGA